MQTFRAYLKDHAGAITWAAWIEAADLSEATRKAPDLSGHAAPRLDMWSASDRRPDPAWKLDPV